MAKAMGGRITVGDGATDGTCFDVDLPLVPAAVPQAPEVDPAPAPAADPMFAALVASLGPDAALAARDSLQTFLLDLAPAWPAGRPKSCAAAFIPSAACPMSWI
ncbi:sensor histidine kinase (plasmid) [Tistrella mobilis]|uniref:sensor histidine kinase n=1 Tax=Tistrella mobilis TaxID=171437 RepID=UPI0035570398